jgi:hypothetical protein
MYTFRISRVAGYVEEGEASVLEDGIKTDIRTVDPWHLRW